MIDANLQQKLITHWRGSAEKNWAAAQSLFKLKHYEMCLFCCHLTLEKHLKALVAQNAKNHPPLIHDLNRLAQFAILPLAEEQENYLNEITKFNIQARYDDIKLAFYKKADKEFCKKYLAITKKLILWLNEKYLKQ